jgi:hypothetical protein
MAKNKKVKGKNSRKSYNGDRGRHSTECTLTREYNYLLRITLEDSALLEQYQETIALGTAGFAEVYYNHLFDNPDIADTSARAAMSANWCVRKCRTCSTLSWMPRQSVGVRL